MISRRQMIWHNVATFVIAVIVLALGVLGFVMFVNWFFFK